MGFALSQRKSHGAFKNFSSTMVDVMVPYDVAKLIILYVQTKGNNKK